MKKTFRANNLKKWVIDKWLVEKSIKLDQHTNDSNLEERFEPGYEPGRRRKEALDLTDEEDDSNRTLVTHSLKIIKANL